MTGLVPVPLVLPLLAAAISMALGRRHRVQRALGLMVLATNLAVCVLLLLDVRDGSVLASRMGDWPAQLGITLVVDAFAGIMLSVSALMLLMVMVYAIGSPLTDDETTFFHPLYLVLAAGISASFLTSDLFNLFVAFEMTLVASYVLITLGGSRDQVRHGMTYVVISLLASILFITSVALTYSATGTVNMADLTTRLQMLDPGLRSALGLLFLAVFGIKAAIFPLFFWLPDSYPVAPSPVTAIFAGLLTKVGVYAIIRTQTLLFGDLGVPSTLLLVIAGATMVVGVLGAISQGDIKRILSFHIISQIGYMIFGLALFNEAGLAATVFYIVHHIIIKTTLLLVAGLVEERAGTGILRELGGLQHASPLLAVLFLLPALSLAGIPPSSGFVAKLALVQAGIGSGAFIVVAASLVVSLLTLFSMTKIWGGSFWGDPPEKESDGLPPRPSRRFGLATLSTTVLVVASLAFVVFAAPLYDLGEQAASILMRPDIYAAVVLGS